MHSPLTLILFAASLAGCGARSAEQRLSDTYEALADRVQAHITATSSTDDAPAIASETTSYCADMADRSDDMESACDDMMDGGMMDGGMMDHESQARLLDALDAVRDEVDRHCVTMDGLDDAGAMHDECDTHDEAIGTKLDALGREVPDA